MAATEAQVGDAFVQQYAKLVQRIAARLRAQLGANLDKRELEACGLLGLMEARKHYDAERGVRFSTFAYYRIRGEMLDGVRRSGYLSRRAHARLRAAEALDQLAEPLAHTADSANRASRAQLLDDTLGKITAAYTVAALGQDADSQDPVDAEQRVDVRRRFRKAMQAVEALPPREQQLIRGIYFEDRTLNSVCTEMGLSKSWGSRLHSRVLGKLRDALTD